MRVGIWLSSIALVLMMMTGVVGCQLDEEDNEAAAGAAFKVATGMAAQQSLVQDGGLIPGLPVDVPTMDGASIVSAAANTVTFTVEVSGEEVLAYYQEQLAANDWTLQEDQTTTEMRFAKDDRTAQVTVGESEPTEVTVTVTGE